MARNRKNGSQAIGFGPVLKALLLCLLIAGAGVGYVWQKEQINRLSRQIDERGVRLSKLLDDNQNRKRLLADLRSLGSVEARIKVLNLGLAQPSPAQVWHLVEPSRQAPRPAPPPAVRRAKCPSADSGPGHRTYEPINGLLPPPVTPSDEEPIAAGGRQLGLMALSSRPR